MISAFIAGSIVLAGSAYAQTTHQVTTDGLAYSPNTLSNVAEGDMIRLTFSTSIPHDVLSSTYDAPCTYNAAGGVASGVYNAGEVFVWRVNSTDPAFFFCSVGQHCQSGMVLAINPSDSETQEGAAANAVGTTSEDGPGSVVGGMLESDMDNTASTSTAPSSTSATSTTGTSSMPTTTGTASASATPDSSANGMRSGVAMGAAVVGAAIAFAV